MIEDQVDDYQYDSRNTQQPTEKVFTHQTLLRTVITAMTAMATNQANVTARPITNGDRAGPHRNEMLAGPPDRVRSLPHPVLAKSE